MGQTGILKPAERVELLAGEVIIMSPIGHRHAACVDRLTGAFAALGARLAGRALCLEVAQLIPARQGTQR